MSFRTLDPIQFLSFNIKGKRQSEKHVPKSLLAPKKGKVHFASYWKWCFVNTAACEQCHGSWQGHNWGDAESIPKGHNTGRASEDVSLTTLNPAGRKLQSKGCPPLFTELTVCTHCLNGQKKNPNSFSKCLRKLYLGSQYKKEVSVHLRSRKLKWRRKVKSF